MSVAIILLWPVTPKSVPPKIGPAGPILAKNLPKVVPWTTFATKIGLAGQILAAKIGPPLPILVPPGDRFWQEVICQNRSPSLLFPILHYRAIPLGTCIGSYSYS